ncbi:hypothetical protein ACQEVM_37150 [Streptomyces sp. CA-243310]|uniref:hypothetical protein n=1 Tax=Streptomyces sp. CA-243310 TaxID=3240056 RepID=UPI003D8D5C7E
MAEIWECTVCAVLAIWLAASAAAQHKKARNVLLSWWDKSWASPLLPVFTFFAPRPASRDYYLLVRTWSDGDLGPWREIQVDSPWRWFHCVWNPAKRQGKAFSDIINNLLTAPPKSDVQCVLHNSYLQLLSLVSSIDSQVDSTHLQFMVVGVGGYNSDVPSTVTLLSNLHVRSTKKVTCGDGRARP